MTFLKWLDDHLEERVVVVSLIILSSLTIINVVLRYCTSYSLTWSEEICKLSLITSGFFSIGYCIKNNVMLSLDVFLQFVSIRIRKFLEFAVLAILFLFFLIALYAGIKVVQENVISGQESAALAIPIYYIYLIAASGFALAIFRLLQRFVMKVRKVGNETSP
jgi:TRAP-type C4-dicarboxylate transport system permease small subunit